MIISHNLTGNGYFINNEIWMKITADSAIVYFKVVLRNLSNSKISTQFIAYADINRSAYINLQPIVKSLFSVPDGSVNSSAKIEISITGNEATNIKVTKDFIRGGNRTNEINQTFSPNQTLRLSNMLPVWSGFPAYDYFLSSSYVIQEQTLAEISNIDYRRIKGCNNIYIKFLNQRGGYSYWLFESYSEKETGTPLGSLIDSSNNLLDMGQESKSDLQIYSKIPKEYKQYALDLIISPDVYAYQNGLWKKIFMKSNNVERDSVKRVYTVNLNIDLQYRFNPSILWSN